MRVVLSKPRKFVADGVFFSEINQILSKELEEDGFSEIELRKKPSKVEIIVRGTKTQSIIGQKGKRIRELTRLLEKRFFFGNHKIELFVEKVVNRGLCANSQADSLRFKLLKGLAVRRACYSIIRSTMESGAKGCMVTVSGKLRAQRAKTMKFLEGYMIRSGNPVDSYVQKCTRHCFLQQGVIGVKVAIMLPWDPMGIIGPKKPLPDVITVFEAKKNI
jgi:small subunit ribosomal protein S3e